MFNNMVIGMKKKIFTTEFITKVGILAAIETILYFLGGMVTISGVSINLALIPIAFGAIMFGPLCGALLGFLNGAMVLADPNTQAVFMNVDLFGPWSIPGTILVCLLKCSIAGAVSGYLYKLLKKHDLVAIIVASFAVPIVNTSIFVIGAVIFFNPMLRGLLAAVFSFNLLVEIGITAIFTPAIIRLIYIERNKPNEQGVPVTEENNEEK